MIGSGASSIRSAWAGRILRPLHRPEGKLEGLLRLTIYAGVGALVGGIAWGQGEHIWGLVGLLLLPLLWGASTTRWEGLALMLSYFAAGARGLPGGAVVFFGDTAPHWWGFAMWLGASMLLSMPFVLCWSSERGKRAAGFVLAVFACLVPPLGIVGWLSPLSVAGILFPSGGWLGLALTGLLVVALALLKGRLIAVLAVAVAIANLASLRADSVVRMRWMGFDTSFPKLSSAAADQATQFLSSMDRIQWLRGVVADMPAGATLLLPETVLGRFDGVAQTMLSQAEGELVGKNSRVLVGAELPEDSGRYKNALVVLGAQRGDDRAAIQGIPVPISMWKPWASDGAEADLLARGNTITVDGLRVGAAICYEQLLAYSLLRLMVDKPDLIAAVSNVWWARATNIPQIQFQSVHAFARLFGVPVFSARNM